MAIVLVVLLLAVVLAAVVIIYVAFPYRGEQTPVSPAVGEAMRRGVDSLPTLDPDTIPVSSRQPFAALAGSGAQARSETPVS